MGSIYVNESDHDRIETLAEHLGRTKIGAVRYAVDRALEKTDDANANTED